MEDWLKCQIGPLVKYRQTKSFINKTTIWHITLTLYEIRPSVSWSRLLCTFSVVCLLGQTKLNTTSQPFCNYSPTHQSTFTYMCIMYIDWLSLLQGNTTLIAYFRSRRHPRHQTTKYSCKLLIRPVCHYMHLTSIFILLKEWPISLSNRSLIRVSYHCIHM